MRLLLRFAVVVGLMLAGWAAPPRAQAATLDTTADRVFGQTDFTHNIANNGGRSATSLFGPGGMALDVQGNLYVADVINNRVLEYNAPLSTGMAASRVFGQAGSFTTGTFNTGGLSANSLSGPDGLALDAQGNLYIADFGNNRVLEYDTPLGSDTTADRVFGQAGSFTTGTFNTGGLSANSLSGPGGLALDAQGNLYVADSGNNRVLEYDTPLGSGTTADRFFGQPSFITNTVNNPSLGADSLHQPRGLTLDALGNLYVADTLNHRVLEYDAPLTTDHTADHVLGQPGFNSNGPDFGADRLNQPYGVAADAQGNLYIADNQNNRVVEYDTPLTTDLTADRSFGQPDFTTTDANHGGLSATSLAFPNGVALDARGNLYVADASNHRVLEYDVPVPYGAPALAAISPSTVAAGSPALTLTANGSDFVAGSIVRWNGSDRPTAFLNSKQLNASISAADVAAGGPFAVTVFTPLPGGGTSSLINLTLYARARHDATADVVQGQPNFTAHAADDPVMAGANQLNFPGSVAVDVRSRRLFVADGANNRVLSWPNVPAFANGQPADLVLGQPNLLADISNNGGVSAKSLSGPFGVALDGQGNLYVADFNNNRVLEYNAPLSSGMAASRVFGQNGSFTTTAPNNGGVTANSLSSPAGLAVDKQGNLYVPDGNNNRVLEYDTPLISGTTADHVFGQGGSFTTGLPNNGTISANSLFFPQGVALDEQGQLYVADRNNNRVLEYDAPLTTDQTADRVVGQADLTHNGSGGASATSLLGPQMVVLDDEGNLYAADSSNNRVLEYDAPLSSGMAASHVFGQPDFTSSAANNGGASATSLSNPIGVALDGQGSLYVADFLNHRVLEYDWALIKISLPLVRR